MNLLISSFNMVCGDPYFWPSMAFTTMIGIFIGAVVYDGILREVKKGILSIGCYALLILTVNFTRIYADLPTSNGKPLNSITTILIVTIFYVLGMFIGVRLTNRANKGEG